MWAMMHVGSSANLTGRMHGDDTSPYRKNRSYINPDIFWKEMLRPNSLSTALADETRIPLVQLARIP